MNTSLIDYSSRYVAPPRLLLAKMKILVAGDSRGTVESLRSHLFQKTCEVEGVYTLEEIQKKLARNSFDLLICGFLLNEEYALRIIEITRRMSDVRILFLVGKQNPEFIVKVLDLGADDCLTSPASFFELDARILRLCRRGVRLTFRDTRIVLGALEIDLSNQSVKKNGKHIPLTKMEYSILLHFALNRRIVVPRKDLEKTLLPLRIADGHSVNMHILNLRKKIPEIPIKTISGRGFILEA